MTLTMGSLFEGSGGFSLGGLLAKIKPVWSSEIEPFPIRVTQRRLPFVKHYGDVSVLSGAELEPVDIITFGSPCQGMSQAGKRLGLNDLRSNLFFQAIRIIKEMREATNGRYPRYAVWENVTGAFSSNAGDDFRAVLEALCHVKDPEVMLDKPKEWCKAGGVSADDYSIAWRTFDAQYWGVPQRRKRVYLVADFASANAGRILFESEGMSRYSAARFAAWQNSTRTPEKSTGTPGVDVNQTVYENHSQDTRYTGPLNVSQTVSATYGMGGNNQPLVVRPQVFGLCSAASNAMRSDNPHSGIYKADTSRTLDCNGGNPVCNQGGMVVAEENKAATLVASDWKDPPVVAFADKAATLTVCDLIKSVTGQQKQQPESNFVAQLNDNIQYIVRRLTPVECARLQGFPDAWCSDLEMPNPTADDLAFWADVFETHRRIVPQASKPKTENQIKKWLASPYSDSAAYKMYGNGVALPCVFFVMAGIAWHDDLEWQNAHKPF